MKKLVEMGESDQLEMKNLVEQMDPKTKKQLGLTENSDLDDVDKM